MSQICELSHPLVQHHLTALRDRRTRPAEFRSVIQRLAVLLAYEATADLQLAPTKIETPLASITGQRLLQRIALVPILRAGLGLVEPILDLLPDAEVLHMGFYRDEATALPIEYYKRLPQSEPADVGLVLDPMLATGGSASLALAALEGWGVKRLKLLSVIAAPEGVQAITTRFPEIAIHVCAIDAGLNERKFIVPGLGDAGDRTFNT
jgi:uracil phosphoribosyltransferase